MILFLNFAPISFMGGAEKWMNDTAKKINSFEKTHIFSVDPSLANIYGQLVLKRKFDNRLNKNSLHNHNYLTLSSFIPFSKNWQKAKKIFKDSRSIYIKYELLELFIVFYFLGMKGFKKILAGLHSPFIYSTPKTFFEKLHNLVYGSKLNLNNLSSAKKVHVLNKRDLNFLEEKINNVVYVPNGIEESKTKVEKQNPKVLNILFVGELSERKGIDILINVIKNSPNHFKFTIAGDGPLKEQIKNLSHEYKNFNYLGFLSKSQLKNLYQKNDVLILPSRAESMPLSILEAMSYGLLIVNSSDISLNLSKKIEYSTPNTPWNYLLVLGNVYKQKQKSKINRSKVISYFQSHFSLTTIHPKLLNQVFKS